MDNPHDVALNLTPREHPIDPQNPWADDLVGRDELASKLTRLVLASDHPMRCSLHGPWGSGKTYLLRRWQQELENAGFRAIYYNAWEDDSCNEPLLAMLGQLGLEFDQPEFRNIIRLMGKASVPLLEATTGALIQSTTGFPLQRLLERIRGRLKTNQAYMLDEYVKRRKVRAELKESVNRLAARVKGTTQRPLVFIIDELDRCRPAYAVQCLEHVKHIMDVPGVVFVLGINRDELCKAVQYTNGQIDASTYLLRFFDFEFNLPEADPRRFCWVKLEETGVGRFFLYDGEGDSEGNWARQRWQQEYRSLQNCLPTLCQASGMSLRDIEHCTRMIALATATMERFAPVDVSFLGVLPILKLKNPELYREFIQGRCATSKVTNYLDQLANAATNTAEIQRELTRAEIALILGNHTHDPETAAQLRALAEGKAPARPELLPNNVKAVHQSILSRYFSNDPFSPSPRIPSTTMMAEYIDLYQMPTLR